MNEAQRVFREIFGYDAPYYSTAQEWYMWAESACRGYVVTVTQPFMQTVWHGSIRVPESDPESCYATPYLGSKEAVAEELIRLWRDQ